MIAHFTEGEKAVHYPKDRRAYLGMKLNMKIILLVLFIGILSAAWLQYLVFGLPANPTSAFAPLQSGDPLGFPVWINPCHWVNFFFLMLIIRSGLSILAYHPRLYWNNSFKPNSPWIRFTPAKIPIDTTYTAKEDASYLSPIAGLPGYKHTVSIARVCHSIFIFLGNELRTLFTGTLSATEIAG